MRIALLIENLRAGGAERVVQRVACGLSRRGHRAHLYCLREAEIPLDKLRRVGVVVREARSTGRDPALAWRLGRWLHEDHIDVVHAHNCAALAWALPAARVLGLPLVHVRHGVLLGQRTRYARLARHLDRLVDRVVVVSEEDRTELPTHLARRAVRIPNGIDLPRLARTEARAELECACERALRGPVVLSVGTICAEKDTVGLLHAFAELRRHQPEATLVCVGPQRGADYAVDVRLAVQQLGLAGDVVFTGAVAEAWRLLAGADVFCLSSATEAMPNVVVEALSQGVPIVATAVGDVAGVESTASADARWILYNEKTALVVRPGRPRELAAALRRTLEQPTEARQRAERGYADYLARFTADPMLDAYEQLYADCLRRRGKPLQTRRAAGPQRRLPVVMVGPRSQQIGGMTSVIEGLLASPLREQCELTRWSPPFVARTDASPNHPSASGLLRRGFGTISACVRHAGALWDLVRCVHRARAQVVHIHTCSYFSFYRSVIDAAVARALGRRVLLHIHGAKFDEFCKSADRLGRWMIRRGSECADALIVLARHWEATLRPYVGKANIVVVPNGVALGPDSEPPTDRATCRFVFLGALCRRKGVPELIEAAGRLRETGVPFEIVLAGPAEDGDEADWARRIEQAGVEARVKLAGPVHGPAKEELLRSGDCLVLPSHNEGLPMAILEAAARGLAVVATPIGGIPEFMAAADGTPSGTFATPPQDNGDSVRYLAPLPPAGDVAALTEALELLARDAELRREVGRRLRQRVAENYSLDSVAQRLLPLYRTATRKRHKPTLHERFVRGVLYRWHEHLRGRPTLRELARLRMLSHRQVTNIQQLATQRLRDLLQFAGGRLPTYTELFLKHGVDAQAADPQHELAKLPVLEKDQVRANAAGMVCHDAPGNIKRYFSGGTSGNTLYFYIDSKREAQDLAARLWMQSLFGIRPGARRLYLWGSPIETRATLLRRWRDRLLNECVLNAFAMSPTQMNEHLRRIGRFRPRVIYSYPSAAAALARHAIETRRTAALTPVELVVLTGEEITPDQKAQVQAAFACPVVSEYGSREVGLIAHECPSGSLHVLSPHIHVEIINDGRIAKPGEVGDVVCTTLNVRAQPFIRYRVGDVGRLLPGECSCGLPLPVMEIVGGRRTGFIALPDGRLCHGAVSSHMLRGEAGILEFKTLQHALDHIEVLLVVDGSFAQASIERIRRRYHDLFGEKIHVDCHVVDTIPPDPSGKRRHVVSSVAPDFGTFDVVATPTARS